jgi:GT2 family glycosyltransferase
MDRTRGVDIATVSLTSGLSAYCVARRPGWRLLDSASRLRRYLVVPPAGVRQMRREASHIIAKTRHVELRFPTVDHPAVSIVMPVFNNWHLTRRALASLHLCGPLPIMEVIVVDDASTDATRSAVAGVTGLRVVGTGTNVGFTRAANQGARAARGTWTLFLNNDTMILPGCIEALVGVMSDERIGAAGARLVYPSGWLQEAGGLIDADGRGWHLGHRRNPADPKFGARRDVDYCSAAALMVRSALLLEIGYFDERYAPAYYEDTDLCFQVRARGFRTVVEPAATVVHWEGMTHGTERRHAYRGAHTKANQELNRVTFLEKWGAELAGRTASAASESRRS